MNRQRATRQLHIHPNTIDYRLRRIRQATGVDRARNQGLWYQRSALGRRAGAPRLPVGRGRIRLPVRRPCAREQLVPLPGRAAPAAAAVPGFDRFPDAVAAGRSAGGCAGLDFYDRLVDTIIAVPSLGLLITWTGTGGDHNFFRLPGHASLWHELPDAAPTSPR